MVLLVRVQETGALATSKSAVSRKLVKDSARVEGGSPPPVGEDSTLTI